MYRGPISVLIKVMGNEKCSINTGVQYTEKFYWAGFFEHELLVPR